MIKTPLSLSTTFLISFIFHSLILLIPIANLYRKRIIYSALPVDLISIPKRDARLKLKKSEVKKDKGEEPIFKQEEKKEDKKIPPKQKPTPRSVTSIEAARFPYTYYLKIIQEKVSSSWNPPEGISGKVVVYFRISRDGQIKSPSFEVKSGRGLLNQSALRAVLQASPFPPLPEGYQEDYLGIYFGFELKK